MPRKLVITVIAIAAVFAVGWLSVRNASPADLVLTGIVTTNDVVVSSQMAGRISRLTATEGSTVEANQVVATLEPNELQADRAFYARSAEAVAAQVDASRAELAAAIGPGLVDIIDLLKGSDTPDEDRKTVFKAQILFWLIGATDGHAKNFSIFLGPGGSYSLTPLYDALTAQPSLDVRQIERKQMKLAMAVGETNHYRIDGIHGRHFMQTAQAAGLPRAIASAAIEEVVAAADGALERVQEELPARFPAFIHDSVRRAVSERVRGLASLT